MVSPRPRQAGREQVLRTLPHLPSEEAREFSRRLADLVVGKDVVVATHGNADLDGVASALLACRFVAAKGAISCCIRVPEGASRGSREVMETLGVSLPECELPAKGVDVLLVVDASNWSQVNGGLEGANAVVLLDHHELGSISSGSSLKYVDPSAPTCVELALETLLAGEVEVPGPLATLSLAAIIDETGNFERASPRTFVVAAALIEMGGDYGAALKSLRRRREEGLDLRLARLKAATRLSISKACGDLIVVTTHVGSYEAETARSMVSLGADVAIVFKEGRASIRVSRTALERGVSASDLAAQLAASLGGEGGGHRGAAALNLPQGMDEEEAAARALRLAVAYISKACRGESVGGGPEKGQGIC